MSNYCNGVTANLIGANFFTGFLLLMNASDSYVGLIAMIAMFGNMLQVLSPLLLERFAERKRVLMIGRGTVHFLNIVVISVIPLLVPADALKLSLILIVVLLLNVINAMMAPGYQVWHIKSIPNEIRSRYFSFFTLTNSILVYTVVLAGSQVVDAFKKGGSELTGLLIIRGLAFVLAILDLYFLSKIKEYPVPGRDIKIKDVLFSPFKRKYLITVAIACMWSFSANIPSSFYTVYLLRELKISYSFINTVNMLSVPVMIFFMPIWRKRVDRTSWFRVFNICIQPVYRALSRPGHGYGEKPDALPLIHAVCLCHLTGHQYGICQPALCEHAGGKPDQPAGLLRCNEQFCRFFGDCPGQAVRHHDRWCAAAGRHNHLRKQAAGAYPDSGAYADRCAGDLSTGAKVGRCRRGCCIKKSIKRTAPKSYPA